MKDQIIVLKTTVTTCFGGNLWKIEDVCVTVTLQHFSVAQGDWNLWIILYFRNIL